MVRWRLDSPSWCSLERNYSTAFPAWKLPAVWIWTRCRGPCRQTDSGSESLTMLPVSVELVCWHRLEIFLLAECHKAWNVYLKSVFAISERALLTHILSALSMYLKSVDINRRFIDSYRPPPRGPGWGTSASRPRRLTSTPGWGRGSSTLAVTASVSETLRRSPECNKRLYEKVYPAKELPGTVATILTPRRTRRNQERRTEESY